MYRPLSTDSAAIAVGVRERIRCVFASCCAETCIRTMPTAAANINSTRLKAEPILRAMVRVKNLYGFIEFLVVATRRWGFRRLRRHPTPGEAAPATCGRRESNAAPMPRAFQADARTFRRWC